MCLVKQPLFPHLAWISGTMAESRLRPYNDSWAYLLCTQPPMQPSRQKGGTWSSPWKRLKLLRAVCGVPLARRKGEQKEHLLKGLCSNRFPPSPFVLNAAFKPQGDNKVWKCTCWLQHVDGLVQSLAKQGPRINVPLSKIPNHFTVLRSLIYRKGGKIFYLVLCQNIFVFLELIKYVFLAVFFSSLSKICSFLMQKSFVPTYVLKRYFQVV